MDIENRGEGVEGRMEWDVEVSRCKLLYIEWINNRVLQYNTENYIQNLMINHECKKITYKYM